MQTMRQQGQGQNFNPRPPWGGRRVLLIVAPCTTRPFQSTPSVGRATLFQGSGLSQERRFQSTPSVGRATSIPLHYRFLLTISIHALRGEGDKGTVPARIEIYSFQSTPSVGRATPLTVTNLKATITFQSTPSVGRATILVNALTWKILFQSTPSVGRATAFASSIRS